MIRDKKAKLQWENGIISSLSFSKAEEFYLYNDSVTKNIPELVRPQLTAHGLLQKVQGTEKR